MTRKKRKKGGREGIEKMILTRSNVCLAIKYICLLLLAAFIIYVIVVYPEYRWYAIIFILLALVCRFQAWRFTPCDKRRVEREVRKEISRRRRRYRCGSSSSGDMSSRSSLSSSSAATKKRGKKRGKRADAEAGSRKGAEKKTRDAEPYGDSGEEDDEETATNTDDDDEYDQKKAQSNGKHRVGCGHFGSARKSDLRPIVQKVFVVRSTRGGEQSEEEGDDSVAVEESNNRRRQHWTPMRASPSQSPLRRHPSLADGPHRHVTIQSEDTSTVFEIDAAALAAKRCVATRSPRRSLSSTT
jgi:hypothetical protein